MKVMFRLRLTDPRQLANFLLTLVTVDSLLIHAFAYSLTLFGLGGGGGAKWLNIS